MKGKTFIKSHKILQITGIITQVLKHSQRSESCKPRIYITLAVPTPIYGSGTWTIKEKFKSRITAAEIIFFRKVAKYMLFCHKIKQDF
jgi:hypothetical protein